MVVLTLSMMTVLAVGALVLDGGLNYLDKRTLQRAADAGALAGAASLGTLGTAATNQALTNGQSLTWQNLRLPVGACSADTGNATIGIVRTCSGSGYTVTVTYPYANAPSGCPTLPFPPGSQDCAHPPFPPESTVGVDISHNNPSSGLSAVMGFNVTSIGAHAAAVAQPGTRQFPFALATRFLELLGGGTINSFGSVLIGACSSDGAGDFKGNSGVNGGIHFNGSTKLSLGASISTASGPTYYTSPQAVTVARANTANCTSTASNDPASWSSMSDHVDFSASASEFNPYWAFNAGPVACTPAPSPTTCETTPAGDTPNWTDNCWKTGSTDAPILAATASTAPFVDTYNQDTDTYSLPPPVTCTTGVGAGHPSYEGSYDYADFPTFPLYTPPETIVDSLSFTVPTYTNTVPSSSGTSVPCSGTVTPGASGGVYYTSYACADNSGQQVLYEPGWYVFDFPAVMSFSKSNDFFRCDDAGTPAHGALNGCVFIFRHGASLSISSSGTLDCATTGTVGGCSMEFEDTGTTPSPGNYLSISQGSSIGFTPIPYTQDGLSFKFPVVYSHGATDCLDTSSPCAVSMSQASFATQPITGTVFVPHGIIDVKANATAATGQLIADTIRLQTGSSSASTGVAYKGGAVAPVPGAAVLVE